MGDLSLKGVARRYRGVTGNFSVIADICWAPTAGETISLRARLEALAREEHHFQVYDGSFEWRAAYQQTWTHIAVRINLNFIDIFDHDTRNSYRAIWKSNIESTWSNLYECEQVGDELPCRISFEVQWWGETGYHHLVSIWDSGPEVGRSTKYTWITGEGTYVPVHEFGHMIGLVDEYEEKGISPYRTIYTNTLMACDSLTIPSRYMHRFAAEIGSEAK